MTTNTGHEPLSGRLIPGPENSAPWAPPPLEGRPATQVVRGRWATTPLGIMLMISLTLADVIIVPKLIFALIGKVL